MSSDTEKLAAVVALVDSWMAKAGPGTEAHNVMGKQVVSVEFVHSQVHAITDVPSGELKHCPQCGPGVYMCEHTIPEVAFAKVVGYPNTFDSAAAREAWRAEIAEAKRTLPKEEFAGWLNRRINAARGSDG